MTSPARSIARRIIVLVLVLLPLAASAAAGASAAASANDAWVPTYSSVETGPYKTGGRYVETTMIWADVSAFGPGSTYEQDFSLDNNPDRPSGQTGTYFSRAENIQKQPAATYWASNLPSAYLDTRLLENRDEEAYTIGSGDAHAIKANVEYFTLIVMPDGDAKTDTASLRAQLGFQFPPGCTSTWCSFSRQQVFISGVWSIPVPGSVTFGAKPP